MRNHVLPIVTRAAADQENARWLRDRAQEANKVVAGTSTPAPASARAVTRLEVA